MKLTVHDYRAIAKAEIDLAPIALISGQNEAGKSSLSEALRACLTGQPMPMMHSVDKMTKADFTALVHDGATAGVANLFIGDTVRVTVRWPSGDVETTGQPPTVSPVAAGIVSFANVELKDRPAMLVRLLGADPNQDDIKAFMGEKTPAPLLSAMWTSVEKLGWDGAHQNAKTRGTEFKGAWEQITGERWGVQKAEGWTPERWEDEWAAMLPPDAAEKLGEARQALAKIQASATLAEHEHATLKREAEAVNQRDAEVKRLDEVVARLTAKREQKQKVCEELPPDPASDSRTLECPACHAKLLPVPPIGEGLGNAMPYRLLPYKGAEVLSDTELKQRRLARAAADGELARVKTELAGAEQERETARAALRKSREAIERLQGAETENAEAAAARQDASNAVEYAQQRFEAIERRAQAALTHRKILNTIKAAECFSPGGVRKTKLLERLADFNKGDLRNISELISSPPVRIDEDMVVWVGERRYRDMSESAKFRARIVLQLAWAMRDRSPIVVIDNDVDMDKRYYGRLLNALLTLKLHALVSFRADRREAALTMPAEKPALKQQVRCYWLERGEGVAERLP